MTDIFHQNDSSFLHIEKWQQLNSKLIAGFTTRAGGASRHPFDTLNLGLHVPDLQKDVLANRQLLAEKLAFPMQNWASGEQIHGASVHLLNEKDKGSGSDNYQTSIKGIDGMITDKPGILCTAFFADCVPLFFYDPVSGFIGIAHAGWKGTVNRIAEQMVEKLTFAGVNLSDLLVVIGPCISKGKYEVDENVISHINVNDRENTTTPTTGNHYLLDLKQLNVEILLQSGVLRTNIDVTNYCTFINQELFFSHRRDHGETGRMLGYIGYKP